MAIRTYHFGAIVLLSKSDCITSAQLLVQDALSYHLGQKSLSDHQLLVQDALSYHLGQKSLSDHHGD